MGASPGQLKLGAGAPRAWARCASPAFTLVELAVVLALLAILTAMILPEMRGTYRDARLRAGSRELMDVCAMASSRAISFRQVHRLHILPDQAGYRLERQVGGGGEPVFVPVKDAPGTTGRLAVGISARIRPSPPAGPAASPRAQRSSRGESQREAGDDAGADGGLVFRPDGTATPADVVLRDTDGHGLILRINPVTSRVRVLSLGAS